MINKNSFEIDLEVIDNKLDLLSLSQDKLIGKVIRLDLTNITRGRNCEARFVINKVDNNLIGKIFYFGIYPSYIRRIIGRGISIVEDSFICDAKDAKIRVKPFMITRKRVHRSVKTALRKECSELVKKFAVNHDYMQFFQAAINSTIQKGLSKKLKKIYPLAVCEIRAIKVEKFLERKAEPKTEAKTEDIGEESGEDLLDEEE